MTATWAMLLLASVCWAFRVLFIVVVPAGRLPARAQRALGHLAPAVLAALVAVEASASASHGPGWVAAYVAGAVVLVGLIARWRRSLTWAVLVAAALTMTLDLVLLH